MIYTASYFQETHHHGQLVPISRGIPPQYRSRVDAYHPLRELLQPPEALLTWWKAQEQLAIESGAAFPLEQQIDEYTAQYREAIKAVLPDLKTYLAHLEPASDETWLCWEAPGEFCHRNLAFALVERFRPDCVGGQDAPTVVAMPEGFEEGMQVQLRGVPNLAYEVVDAVPGNLTQNTMLKLLSPQGGYAYWFPNQLEVVK